MNELDAVARSIQMGAEDFLPKPVNAIILRARVSASLERKRLRDLEKLRLPELQREKQRAEMEHEKSERLLLNILPASIAERLKRGERSIAERFEEVTVLFADIVEFTALASHTDPDDLVTLLNELFSRFDRLAERHGLEKIKTIGDSYLVVGGLPIPRVDHAEAVAEMALGMLESVHDLNRDSGMRLRIRIGLNSGPVIADVIVRAAPDGSWLAFADCHFQKDPGHDWADVCVSRPDGTGMKVLTEGQPMWFGATYGDAAHRGGGSNVVSWSRDGAILFPRRLPGSKVPWEYQSRRPDTDHFNRDYHPELAAGGVQVAAINPVSGQVHELTPAKAGRWDFRISESPEGRDILFCRAETGGVPSIWLMRRDGSSAHPLAQGLDGGGADHPRWIGAAGPR